MLEETIALEVYLQRYDCI